MVSKTLQVLAKLAEPLALCLETPHGPRPIVPEQLLALYDIADGFFCLDRSLLVRPISRDANPEGSFEWRRRDFWQFYFNRDEYFYVFAEDAFGDPFCLIRSGIIKLNMETTERFFISETIDKWAEAVLDDPEEYLNTFFMREWVFKHGDVPVGFRLAPKTPFVLGGEYSEENFTVLPEAELAHLKSQVAFRVKNVPDGGHLKIDLE